MIIPRYLAESTLTLLNKRGIMNRVGEIYKHVFVCNLQYIYQGGTPSSTAFPTAGEYLDLVEEFYYH